MAAPEPHGDTRPAEGTGSLRDDLGFALGVVFRAYAKGANAVIGKIPGGPRGYQILTAAVSDEVGSQSSLAQRLGIDRTVMTYLIDDLEEQDLVKRQPDPADRRNRHIVATPRGREQLCDAEKQLRLVEDHILGGISPDDAETLRGLLRQLAARLHNLDPAAHLCSVAEEATAQPQRTPRESSPARLACTDATARNASRR
jgi:DNA-binding MarR family transcriptional regulator